LALGSLLTAVRGIGPVRFRALASAGFSTVEDLLHLLPSRYEDRRTLSRLAGIGREGRYTVQGRIEDVARVSIRRRNLSLVRGRLAQGEDRLALVWFNRPYLAARLIPGAEYLLHGAVRRRNQGWEMVNPMIEPAAEEERATRIVPVYPAVAGLGPAQIGRFLKSVLGQIDLDREVREILPQTLLEKHGLPSLSVALREIHVPSPESDIDQLNRRVSWAHRRLVYGELLQLQVDLALLRRDAVRVPKKHRYQRDTALYRKLQDSLPFRLTGAQRRVMREIRQDLEAPYPMMRLLQGDVGSGKTAVAALALALAIESGLQGTLMAPTEILAEQHYQSFLRLLGNRYRIALLTGSTPETEAKRQWLAEGKADLAIGTHALIQEGVRFSRLGLAVIDEQHRFGVGQRRLLQHKGDRPDLLVMTATPIPRSLALTVYGDLSLSLIDELPPGRSPVETKVVPQSARNRVYRWLEGRLESGAQAYVVLPLIEESSKVDAASIEGVGQEVAGRFGAYSPQILHGQTEVEERGRIMAAFASGEVKVLIATTLVEVGVDVPSATVMIIESAERFGLAQLHQLRGRVGRGSERSHCVAIHGSLGEEARRRLAVFAETGDGFRIAEADLEIRGPGDLLGIRQAGLPLFRVADLIRDREWIEKARTDAREMVSASVAEKGDNLLDTLSSGRSLLDYLAGA
jgi:ATP-dependent DNA helicase RecG